MRTSSGADDDALDGRMREKQMLERNVRQLGQLRTAWVWFGREAKTAALIHCQNQR